MASAFELIFYKEQDGAIPVLDWLHAIPKKAKEKGEFRLKRLAEKGNALRRPEADYLRDGIYELRWQLQNVHYRILYFFFGRESIVLGHGLTKEAEIPDKDVALTIHRRERFRTNPWEHRLVVD